MIRGLIRSLRPHQWVKNIFIFAAIVFDRQVRNTGALIDTLIGFMLFCLISSAVYLFNDVADIEADRNHPRKRHRPIASGLIPRKSAITIALSLAVITLIAGFLLSVNFGLVILVYSLLNLAYSFKLKRVPIVDVMIIAAGFVLRVLAGVVLISVTRFSPWLYLVTTLGALFIGFGKRYSELKSLLLSTNNQRPSLDGYSLPILDQLLSVTAASILMAYALYTFSADNLPPNHAMMLTIPFVLFGIFRYFYLIHTNELAGAPDELIFKDRPMQITILLWILSILTIFYIT